MGGYNILRKQVRSGKSGPQSIGRSSGPILCRARQELLASSVSDNQGERQSKFGSARCGQIDIRKNDGNLRKDRSGLGVVASGPRPRGRKNVTNEEAAAFGTISRPKRQHGALDGGLGEHYALL